MKNKWIKTLAVTLVVVCMAGCGVKDAAGPLSEGVMAKEAESGQDLAEKVSAETKAASKGRQDKRAAALNGELFDGRSIQIWKGKENTLLALKEDMLYLYDAVTAQIVAQTKTEEWDMLDFYSYKDGYCAIGVPKNGLPYADAKKEGEQMVGFSFEGEMGCLCIFYDNVLKETRRMVLNDIVPTAALAEWTVSHDGTRLAYCDNWEGMNLYDLNSRKKQKVTDLWTSENNIDLLGASALFFDEDDSHIVFSGQTDQNGTTVPSWGLVGIDGKGYENHILQYDLGTATGYSGKKLLFGEDSLFFGGGMGVIDTKTGKAAYNTEKVSSLPVSGPFFSDDGSVYVTAALDTTRMEIAVWRTSDFSLLHKEVIEDDREEMFYRSPQVCLFPELRACIVCMGGHNDIPQKTVLVQY